MPEQDIIAKYFSKHTSAANVDVGIGDDAAIVTPPRDSKLVITTDTLNEDVHFNSNADPSHLGHKCLAVSLSDLAAMGSSPLWATLNLSLKNIDHNWLNQFSNGLFSLADKYKIIVIGGDLVNGPTSFTVQAIGCIKTDVILTRSSAKDGDLIYVSGTIGDAVLGLKLLNKSCEIDISNHDKDFYICKYSKPEPRLDLGQELLNVANAAIDVSDGLLIDLERILSSSKVGADLYLEKIPYSTFIENQYSGQDHWQELLTGGDDYEILFTCDEARQAEIEKIRDKLNCRVTQIGKINDSGKLKICKNGIRQEIPKSLGYDHFC